MQVRLFQPWLRLVVKQKLQTCEILTGCEQENRWNCSNLILVLFMNVEIGIWNYPLLLRFNVTGAQGEILYWAKENSSCCDRFWCGNVRYFQSWYSFRSFGNAKYSCRYSDDAKWSCTISTVSSIFIKKLHTCSTGPLTWPSPTKQPTRLCDFSDRSLAK